MYEPTVYMSRCVASAAGLNPVNWLRASYDTLHLVATGRHKLRLELRLASVSRPSNTYATVVGRIT